MTYLNRNRSLKQHIKYFRVKFSWTPLNFVNELIGLFAVELLDPFDVVGSEFDVGREAAVERRHQSGPLVAVRQSQRVSELVGRRLEEICAWSRNEHPI